jgi:hypothetical protein
MEAVVATNAAAEKLGPEMAACSAAIKGISTTGRVTAKALQK